MGRPKEFDQDMVLGAAVMVFWKQGFEATSMRDLEKATKLTPGSIYNEFGSKVGLFEQSLEYYIDRVVKLRVGSYLGPRQDPLDGIREFLVTSVKGVPSEVKGDACLLVNTATELGKSDDSILAVMKRGFTRIENGFYEQLLRAQEQQQVREDLDCKQASKQLMYLMSGLLVASKTQMNLTQVESTVDFTLAGLK